MNGNIYSSNIHTITFDMCANLYSGLDVVMPMYVVHLFKL